MTTTMMTTTTTMAATTTSPYFHRSNTTTDKNNAEIPSTTTTSRHFWKSPCSVHGCVESLGHLIYTWVSLDRHHHKQQQEELRHKCQRLQPKADGSSISTICSSCRLVIEDASMQFDDCHLFRHHMDLLMIEDPQVKLGSGHEDKDEASPLSSPSSCAERVGRRMERLALRHLCRYQCYLRAFAPARDWTVLRKALYNSHTDRNELLDKILSSDGWTCRLIHPDDEKKDEEDGCREVQGKSTGDDDDGGARTRKRKLTALNGTTFEKKCAPRTVFVSSSSARKQYDSPVLAVRGLLKAFQKNKHGENEDKDAEDVRLAGGARRRPYSARLCFPEPSSESSSPSSTLKLDRQLVSLIKMDPSLHPLHHHNQHHPVTSPLGLLEELFANCPWRLLLSTIFLNRTQRKQVDALLFQFLQRWPTAASVVQEDSLSSSSSSSIMSLDGMTALEEIGDLLLPMGLRNKRAVGIMRFCRDYLNLMQNKAGQHDSQEECNSERRPAEFFLTRKEVKSLFFCGDYAADAYAMFVRKDFSCILSNDHALLAYAEYQRSRLLLR